MSKIPPSYISRKDTLRVWKLTGKVTCLVFSTFFFDAETFITINLYTRIQSNNFQDLQNIGQTAVIGKKKGQVGIFYPIGDVRDLTENKAERNVIMEDWIPEVRIIK